MKIALVQSWLGEEAGEPVFPIGLASLAASLPGHTVAAFDPNVAGGDPMAALARFLRDFSPEMTGVSLRNIDSTNTRVNVSYLPPFGRTLATVRQETTGPLVVGGAGFSMFAKAIMASWPAINYGVALEGETAFAALADTLSRGNAPSSVPSLFCRDADGEAFFTGESSKMDLSNLPSPDFSILPLTPYAAVPWGIGVETKRGCAPLLRLLPLRLFKRPALPDQGPRAGGGRDHRPARPVRRDPVHLSRFRLQCPRRPRPGGHGSHGRGRGHAPLVGLVCRARPRPGIFSNWPAGPAAIPSSSPRTLTATQP